MFSRMQVRSGSKLKESIPHEDCETESYYKTFISGHFLGGIYLIG